MTCTSLQVLTAHFQFYNRYYTSGVITASYHLSPPTKQEKAYIALLYCQLLNCSKKQVIALIHHICMPTKD